MLLRLNYCISQKHGWKNSYLTKSIKNPFGKIKFGDSMVALYNKTPKNLQLVK